jgi:hypothetical protein
VIVRARPGAFVEYLPIAAGGHLLLALAQSDIGKVQQLLLDMRDPAVPEVLAVGDGQYRQAGFAANGAMWAWTQTGLRSLTFADHQLSAGPELGLPTTQEGQLVHTGPGSLLQIRAGDSGTWFDVRDVDDPRSVALAPGAWPWGAPLAVIPGLALAPASPAREPTAFVLIGLSDPLAPRELARWTLEEAASVRAAAIGAGLVALGTSSDFDGQVESSRVIVYDVRDPSRPRRVGSTDVPAQRLGEVSGVHSDQRGLAMMPAGPWLVLVAERGMNDSPPAQWGELAVLRWSERAPPAEVGRMNLPQPAWSIAGAGTRAVVMTGPSATRNGQAPAPSRLHLIDLSRPESPRQVLEQAIADFPRWIVASEFGAAAGFAGSPTIGHWALPDAGGAVLAPAVELTTPRLQRHAYDPNGWFDAIRENSQTCWQSGNGPLWCEAPGAALAQAVIDGDVLWVADASGALWAYR